MLDPELAQRLRELLSRVPEYHVARDTLSATANNLQANKVETAQQAEAMLPQIQHVVEKDEPGSGTTQTGTPTTVVGAR